MIFRRMSYKNIRHLFSSDFHCGPDRENLLLLTLLENRLLQLSGDILSSRQSSIADQVAAIKGETRVLRNRGFKVPTKFIEKENDDNFRLMVDDIAHSSSDDASGLLERVKLYQKWAEREERNEVKNMTRLERIDDRRFYMKHIRVKGRVEGNDFQDSLSYILPNNLVSDLVAAFSRINVKFGLDFGQPLVVDMGLPYKMQGTEVSSFYNQMKELYLCNQVLHEPYHIHICNFDGNDPVAIGLLESLGDDFVWSVSSNCFSDIFPRENLVYMTPDSPNIMKEFRHDDIFILGACVDIRDTQSSMGMSYAKAERLGIRSARLDLDSFFNFRGNDGGVESDFLPLLAVSDVFEVIADARETKGDWDLAHRSLAQGRKKVLKWKKSKGDILKKINDVRFQEIVGAMRSSRMQV